jgi:hypothetical protein
MSFSAVSREQYNLVRATVGWLERVPDGGLSYVTWWEGDNCHKVDAWESEHALNAFGKDRLDPGMAKVGVTVQPEVIFHPAHEVFAPCAVTLAS